MIFLRPVTARASRIALNVASEPLLQSSTFSADGMWRFSLPPAQPRFRWSRHPSGPDPRGLRLRSRLTSGSIVSEDNRTKGGVVIDVFPTIGIFHHGALAFRQMMAGSKARVEEFTPPGITSNA